MTFWWKWPTQTYRSEVRGANRPATTPPLKGQSYEV